MEKSSTRPSHYAIRVCSRPTRCFFADDNIVSNSDHRRGVGNTRYARELFEALIPLVVLKTGQREIDVAEDFELVQPIIRPGRCQLMIDFESISASNLDAVGKPNNHVDRYVEHVAQLQHHGIVVVGAFIFGFDHNTPTVFENTACLIVRSTYLRLRCPSLFALHNTEKWSQRTISCIRISPQYDLTHVVFQSSNMGVDELEEGYRWISQRIHK